ncbi:hypothetical protein Dvar_51590 [Desulfosarcina variabilis str. Montpellier]|uniref:hypothetical protein n=1 Tax=Desulfosarcina variabilis TaxID=2300 RepID=UPI003AFAC03B
MKKSDKQGWIIIGIVGSIFALISAFAVYASVTQQKYDTSTLCPLEGSYPVVRILIDKTDPWDAQRSARLEKIIRQTKDNLDVSERLAISVLNESGSEVPTPVFDMCNPGRGDQANPLYKNPRRVHQKFEDQFDLPLEQMLVDILKPGTAPRSPILEAIWNISLSGRTDRLVIVSDLMQNTKRLSFYRDNLTSIQEDDEYKANMQAIQYRSITVYYIDRDGISPKRKDQAIAFWKQHLQQMTPELSFNRL